MLVVLALTAAVCYGAGDFFGGFASKRVPAIAVALGAQIVGLIALAFVLPFFPIAFAREHVLWALLAGACGAAGITLFYHALSIGKMGVLSPVTAVLAAALPVLVSRLLGERLTAAQIAGIALALVAIALISFSSENGVREISTAGLRESVLSGFAFGGFYIFLSRSPGASGIDALAFTRLASIVMLAAVALATRTPVVRMRLSLGTILVAGIFDMAANVLYVLATYSGALALAAVLTSLYPASTVALARVVLKERLSATQWAGVGCALLGVALISL